MKILRLKDIGQSNVDDGSQWRSRRIWTQYSTYYARLFQFVALVFVHTLDFRALQATDVRTPRAPTHRNAHTTRLTKPIEIRNEQSGWIDDNNDHERSMYPVPCWKDLIGNRNFTFGPVETEPNFVWLSFRFVYHILDSLFVDSLSFRD